MSQKYKSGDTVELKDKEIGFTDPETGFDISRNKQAKLGDKIGTRTHDALVSGGLLVVSGGEKKSESKTSASASAEVKSDIPEDFPGRKVLVSLGVSYDQVKAMDDDQRLALDGIGPTTVKQIGDYLKK